MLGIARTIQQRVMIALIREVTALMPVGLAVTQIFGLATIPQTLASNVWIMALHAISLMICAVEAKI